MAELPLGTFIPALATPAVLASYPRQVTVVTYSLQPATWFAVLVVALDALDRAIERGDQAAQLILADTADFAARAAVFAADSVSLSVIQSAVSQSDEYHAAVRRLQEAQRSLFGAGVFYTDADRLAAAPLNAYWSPTGGWATGSLSRHVWLPILRQACRSTSDPGLSQVPLI